MNKDLDSIKNKISSRRRRKLGKLIISLFSALCAIALLAALGSHLAVFLSVGAVLVISLFVFFSALADRSVRIFGKERSGVIIEKKLYGAIHDTTIVGGVGSFSGLREYDKYRTPVTVSSIFIRTPDGEIFSVDNLNEDQTAFYEVGDEVILFPGARFPLVTNEPESRQKWLCPVCGTVLPDGVRCTSCGLEYCGK